MPIREWLEGTAYDPDEVAAISAAFDGVCQELGLSDRSDAVVEIVAKAVLDVARTDTVDAAEVRARALQAIQEHRPGTDLTTENS